MSADTWVRCPICQGGLKDAQEAVRGDYEAYLNDDGTVRLWLRFVCTKCGATWEYTKDNIQRNTK